MLCHIPYWKKYFYVDCEISWSIYKPCSRAWAILYHSNSKKNEYLPINQLLPQWAIHFYILFCSYIMYIRHFVFCNFSKKLLQAEAAITWGKNESKNHHKQMRKFYSKSTGDLKQRQSVKTCLKHCLQQNDAVIILSVFFALINPIEIIICHELNFKA